MEITAFKQIGTFTLCVNILFVLFFSHLSCWCVLTFHCSIALSCSAMIGSLTAAVIGCPLRMNEWISVCPLYNVRKNLYNQTSKTYHFLPCFVWALKFKCLCVSVCFGFSVESSSPSLLAPDNTLERSFFIRMKSTLTKRGVHIKSSGYKVRLASLSRLAWSPRSWTVVSTSNHITKVTKMSWI